MQFSKQAQKIKKNTEKRASLLTTVSYFAIYACQFYLVLHAKKGRIPCHVYERKSKNQDQKSEQPVASGSKTGQKKNTGPNEPSTSQKMKESVQDSAKLKEKKNENQDHKGNNLLLLDQRQGKRQNIGPNKSSKSGGSIKSKTEGQSTNSSSRTIFFHKLSQKLETAAKSSFYDLQIVAKKAEHPMENYEVCLHDDMDVKHCLPDKKAVELIPEDSLHLTHIRVYGDGICLPRCCSLLAFGSEDFYEEMRARIVVELAAHRDFYLDSKNLEGVVPMTSETCSDSDRSQDLTKIYASYSEHFNLEVLTPSAIRFIFEAEVRKATVPGAYMGIWQMLLADAVASILKTGVQSLYPEFGGQTVRIDIHKTLQPREQAQHASSPEKVSSPAILWTRVNVKDLPEATWRPNHFVVCLPRATEDAERQTAAQTTSKDATGKKRKGPGVDIRAFFAKKSPKISKLFSAFHSEKDMSDKKDDELNASIAPVLY